MHVLWGFPNLVRFFLNFEFFYLILGITSQGLLDVLKTTSHSNRGIILLAVISAEAPLSLASSASRSQAGEALVTTVSTSSTSSKVHVTQFLIQVAGNLFCPATGPDLEEFYCLCFSRVYVYSFC